MKKVDCDLTVEVNIDCPHCDNVFDLLEIEGLNDGGWLYTKIFDSSGGWGCKNFNEVVDCPNCKKEIKVGDINW